MLRAAAYLLLSLLLPVASCPAQQSPELVKLFNETKKLAANGNARAQGKLGTMYLRGWGVPKDEAQAVFWFRKSAEQGDTLAQGSLGFMYNNGLGVPRDATQAVSWYRKAAEQGDALSQGSLGLMYENGWGVPKDEIEAYAWYNLGAVSDRLARILRDNLGKTITPEARMRAQARTRELQKMIEQRKAGKAK